MHSGTYCMHFGTFCMHSGTFCMHSVRFCMHSVRFCMHSACFLEHSGTFCMNSVTFWNFLHAFWKAYVTACKLMYSFALHLFPVLYCLLLSGGTVLYCLLMSCTDSVCVHSLEFQNGTQTDRHTDIRTCWAASSQLKTARDLEWYYYANLSLY